MRRLCVCVRCAKNIIFHVSAIEAVMRIRKC